MLKQYISQRILQTLFELRRLRQQRPSPLLTVLQQAVAVHPAQVEALAFGDVEMDANQTHHLPVSLPLT